MKTGSGTGMFSEHEKAEKMMPEFFSFRKSHLVRKKENEAICQRF